MTKRITRYSARYRRFRLQKSPQFNLVWGFLGYTLLGWLLLLVPWFHKTSAPVLDHLFTATSAISTTGLTTVGVFDTYNLVGQIIVMLLFQVGGIGYMTLTTYFLLYTTKNIQHYHRRIIGAGFTMPDTIRVEDFLRSVIVFTIVMEVLGAVSFFIGFRQTGMDAGQAVWFSIFHSVSAFCTAGFGLFGDSFEGYRSNGLMNATISILAIAGSLGFIVITDLWYRLTGRSKALSFTTKIVVYGFVLLLGGGTLLLRLTEPLMQLEPGNAWLTSFFQAMTAMTTVGFNTVPTGELSLPLLLFIFFLMYLGASPSGTAGGMKITTLTAMLAVLKSRLLGEKRITFFGRLIPFERLYVATATFIFYTSLVFGFTFLLSFIEGATLERLLFEVASALGTVGLSVGVTGELSVAGKVIFIIIMFIGRVGVLTFGFALLERRRRTIDESTLVEEDLAV